MKYIWEEKDIKYGRFIYLLRGLNEMSENDFYSDRIYQIGYINESSTKDDERGGVCLISISDGMVMESFSKKDMTKELNESNAVPLIVKANYQSAA